MFVCIYELFSFYEKCKENLGKKETFIGFTELVLNI